MLGYVTCEKPEMKIREFELYNGYYCGVCKSIGRRYGQLPRMTLSYDAAFLAVVLAGIFDEKEDITQEHCIIHHIKKKTIVRNEAIDYAADVMLILAWNKFRDDVLDEKKVRAKGLLLLFNRTYKKLKKSYPELCEKIEFHLSNLSKLESEKCKSIDRVAEPFARIMEIVFSNYYIKENQMLSRFGYHLGKWIYLMDALEDIEDNIDTGAYNPLVYRYEYTKKESKEDFRKRIYNDVERNLLIYLDEMGKMVNQLDLKKNKEIVENIVFMGLLRRTEKLLDISNTV